MGVIHGAEWHLRQHMWIIVGKIFAQNEIRCSLLKVGSIMPNILHNKPQSNLLLLKILLHVSRNNCNNVRSITSASMAEFRTNVSYSFLFQQRKMQY